MKNFSKKIEFHILQSFPVSCLNRDDVGSPKTAVIGGVTRARVSSQCWKRAVRLSLHEFGVKLGLRTKKIEQKIIELLIEKHLSQEELEKCSKVFVPKITDDTLVFLSKKEFGTLADAYVEIKDELVEEKNKEDREKNKKIIKKAIKNNIKKESMDALDIALFGRMIAMVTDMDVEAASMFSHAISTHKVSSEIDFFTALDAALTENGITHCLNHVGSLGCVFFTEGPVRDYASAQKSDTELFTRWFTHMLERGIYLAPSQFEAMFLSAAHTQEDLELTLKAAKEFTL